MRSSSWIGNLSIALAATVAATLAAGTALGQHVDIAPRVEGGTIVADGFDDDTSMIVETNLSIFGYDFQEDPLDPFSIQDPGFNARPGSGLPVGGRFGFDIVNGGGFGLAGNAVYWDGTGAVNFGSLPAGVSLGLAFGSQSIAAMNTPGVQEGFFFGPAIDTGGTFHEHLDSSLSGATLVTHDGIYLVGLRFKIDSTTVSPPFVGDLFSNPIWIVYNNGLDEMVHDEAIEWVESNLVPEPSAFALGAVGALIALASRFRAKNRRSSQGLQRCIR